MISADKVATIGFLPIVVITLIFGSYLSIILNNSDFIGTATNSPCSTYFNYDSSNPISVLVLNSGLTGKICVEYKNVFSNSISMPSHINVYRYNSSADPRQ